MPQKPGETLEGISDKISRWTTEKITEETAEVIPQETFAFFWGKFLEKF